MKPIDPKTALIRAKTGSLIVRTFLISIGLLMSLNVFAEDFPFLQDITDAISNQNTIGEQYQGGIIFWLDNTGQHGLIAALADQSTGIQWYNGTYRVTGATVDGIGGGRMNTAIIIAAQIGDNTAGNFAAKVAANYSIQEDGVTKCTGSATETCYADWYLPSKFELNLMYANIGQGAAPPNNNVGGFASGFFYWSSTEGDNVNAWDQYFNNGTQNYGDKNSTLRVRAVRAF